MLVCRYVGMYLYSLFRVLLRPVILMCIFLFCSIYSLLNIYTVNVTTCGTFGMMMFTKI